MKLGLAIKRLKQSATPALLAAALAVTQTGIFSPNAHADTHTKTLATANASSLIQGHPNAQDIERMLHAPIADDFAPTGITRTDYLTLMAGNVDFFIQFQDERGAIIDPVSNGERQYSTPAFAATAGLLIKEAGRDDLLEPATKALTHALTALVQGRAADGHADFYTPMLVHAYRFLKGEVSPQQAKAWAALFKRIDPERIYSRRLRKMNWNIVSSSGELLRRHDGLIDERQMDNQWRYLEMCIEGHMERLTPIGLFDDPGAPIAYDAFTRLWLEDIFADNAYDGKQAHEIESFLRQGGLSTLFLLSPTGEWAHGGRSGMHNWADAQIVAICEINAVYWKKQGHNALAGTFKRAARLAYQSMARWQRPSGELWIIKNRAEPEERLAYERYSNHSQYNLLPMAMLAIAYSRADESIQERPTFSEFGEYIFDARRTFHKVAAAAGGYYLLIDTAADAHYNATGLQRVHKKDVLFPAFSDTTAGNRGYGPGHYPKLAIAPGLTWVSTDNQRLALADFTDEHSGQTKIWRTDLYNQEVESDQVEFNLRYFLRNENGPIHETFSVIEQYQVSAQGVIQTSYLLGNANEFGVQLPVLVSDGKNELTPSLDQTQVSLTYENSTTHFELLSPSLSAFVLDSDRTISHSGHVQRASAPIKQNQAVLKITLTEKDI